MCFLWYGTFKIHSNLDNQFCNIFWVILIDNSWWLFWAHFNRAYFIHQLDFHIVVFVAEPKELSIDLIEHIIDLSLLKSGKLLGAISKQLQVPRSTVQTTVSIKCIAQLCHCQHQKNYHRLLRKNWSGCQESTKNHQKAGLQWIRSWMTAVSVHTQACFTSTWAERLPYKKEALDPDATP